MAPQKSTEQRVTLLEQKLQIVIDEVVGLHGRLKQGLAELSEHEQELEHRIEDYARLIH